MRDECKHCNSCRAWCLYRDDPNYHNLVQVLFNVLDSEELKFNAVDLRDAVDIAEQLKKNRDEEINRP